MVNVIMKDAIFFIEEEVLDWLIENGKDDEDYNADKGVNIVFEIIDMPWRCSIATSEDIVELKMFLRSEIGVNMEKEDFKIKLFSDGSNPEVTLGTNVAGDGFVKFAIICLRAGFTLYEKFCNSESKDIVLGFDAEQDGIIVELEENALGYKKVSGKKRPNLACTTLFGGVEMSRPYSDELMNSWALDMLSDVSFDEILKEAEQGDEDAMIKAFEGYLSGDDVEQDIEKAIYWCRNLAEMGNATGQYNLAVQYVKGEGVEHSFEKALYWMKEAEKNGDPDATKQIEELEAILQNIDKANNGDAGAMAIVANKYMNIGNKMWGESEEWFYSKSLEYSQKSADLNNAEGIWLLALSYAKGRGVDVDVMKAISLYQKAAELGHAPSQNNLGVEYMSGVNIKKDYHKGFELFKASAEQGYGLAMRALGQCYQFAQGTPGNMKTAIEWYEKALEVIDDPELERKVMVFKTLGESDENFGEDYPEEDEDFDPSEIGDFFAVLTALDEYERELAEKGLLPGEPTYNGGFQRVHLKAEEGDEKAISLLNQLDDMEN